MATLEGATVSVDSVAFRFLTDEEVREHSFVKVTSARLLDTLDKPVPGGLYDPALGPLGDEPCKTCGQRSTNCSGHCGHIDLTCPVYNPLLFNFLYKLLQRACFFCFHFRADSNQVEKFVSQLELIIKGDVVGAKRLDSLSPSEKPLSEDSDGSNESCSTIHLGQRCPNSEQSKQSEWTSLQLSEAMSVLNNFLKLE